MPFVLIVLIVQGRFNHADKELEMIDILFNIGLISDIRTREVRSRNTKAGRGVSCTIGHKREELTNYTSLDKTSIQYYTVATQGYILFVKL